MEVVNKCKLTHTINDLLSNSLFQGAAIRYAALLVRVSEPAA